MLQFTVELDVVLFLFQVKGHVGIGILVFYGELMDLQLFRFIVDTSGDLRTFFYGYQTIEGGCGVWQPGDLALADAEWSIDCIDLGHRESVGEPFD